MTTAHSEGPWTRDKYGHVIDAKGNAVKFRSVTICCAGPGVEEAERNTDLATAAPDLLAALQAAIKDLELSGYAWDHPFLIALRAVVAKATGEPA